MRLLTLRSRERAARMAASAPIADATAPSRFSRCLVRITPLGASRECPYVVVQHYRSRVDFTDCQCCALIFRYGAEESGYLSIRRGNLLEEIRHWRQQRVSSASRRLALALPCPQGRRKPTLVGLKENQRINPMQSKFAPAEGVTPPAEVHACPTVHSAPCTTRYRCLPTGVTGSHSRPTPPGFGQIVLCRPDAWVRVSFAHTRVWPDCSMSA